MQTIPPGRSCLQERYVMTFLGFMVTFINSTMKFAFSIAITEIVVPHHINHANVSGDPESCPYFVDAANHQERAPKAGQYDWSETTQGLIFGATWWTYIPLQLPLGGVIERLGPRYVLGAGMLLANLSYIFTPMAITYMGATGFVISRVLLGAGLAPSYPAINLILAKWAPPSEKNRLGGIIHTGENVGFIFAMAMSGLILGKTDGDWPLLFYFYGAIGMSWLVLWAFFGFDDPASHPFISVQEKLYLEKCLSQNETKKKIPPTPWGQIARSWPLWGTLIAQLGHDWGKITIVNQLPKYMKSVLHYEIQANGLLTAIPYLAMTVVAVLSGWISDWLLRHNYITITNVRKLYITIAAVGPSLGVVGAMFAGCDSTLVVVMFTLGIAPIGFYYSSLIVNTLDLSPNYSGTLMGIIGYGGLGGILSPYVAGVLAPEGTRSQWRSVFWVSVFAFLATNVFYLIVGSGEVQPWNEPNAPHSEPLKEKLQEKPQDVEAT